MKKLLALFAAAGLGLALLGAGCTNKLEGTWVSTQPVAGTIVEVEFTKSRIIGSAEAVQLMDATKKSQAKLIVDYHVTKAEENILDVDISNPEANIVGTYADDKQQNQWQEDAKKYLKANDSFTATVAADGKTMIIQTKDGQLVPFRRK